MQSLKKVQEGTMEMSEDEHYRQRGQEGQGP